MKYIPPYGSTNPDQPFWNASPGKRGAACPAEAVEHPMREIVNVILAAGLTPDGNDLTQLAQAIVILCGGSAPQVGDLPTPPGPIVCGVAASSTGVSIDCGGAGDDGMRFEIEGGAANLPDSNIIGGGGSTIGEETPTPTPEPDPTPNPTPDPVDARIILDGGEAPNVALAGTYASGGALLQIYTTLDCAGAGLAT